MKDLLKTSTRVFYGCVLLFFLACSESIKPIEFKGKATRKEIMDGRYFIFETMGGKLIMPRSDGKEVNYQDIAIEGYDNEKKSFHCKGGKPLGNRHWDCGRQLRFTTNTFTYELEIERAGEKRKFHDRIKIIDADHYLLERYHKKGDQEIKVSESNYTRSVKQKKMPRKNQFGQPENGVALLPTIDMIKVATVATLMVKFHWFMRNTSVLQIAKI